MVKILFVSQVNIRGAENLGEEPCQLLQRRDLKPAGWRLDDGVKQTSDLSVSVPFQYGNSGGPLVNLVRPFNTCAVFVPSVGILFSLLSLWT